MTRINTNVSSLVGRKNLQQANSSLSQSLTRLSTGLRINTGKDDPAGLIASENLRSDITSIKRAISNTDRANQVIATADSALGQVSSLLNDIRGLVTESANSGALSDEQIAANQLQVDSSLEALNRIAQTTTFQGRRLLDGSLDFLTTAGTNSTNISNLQIDQANLGATGSVAVDVQVDTAATQASINVAGIDVAADETAATGDLTIALGASSGTGDVDIDLVETDASGTFALTNGGFDLTSATGGAAGNLANLNVTIVDAVAGAGTASYNGTDTITVTLDITNDAANSTIDDVVAAIDAEGTFVSSNVVTGTGVAVAAESDAQALTGGRDASTESITVTSAATGTASNVDVTIVEGAAAGVATDGSGNLTVTILNTGSTSIADIAALIDGDAGFTASTTSTATYIAADDAPPAAATTLAGGADASSETITITTTGNAESTTVTLATATGIGATPTVSGDLASGFTVTVDDALSTSLSDIASALAGDAGIATATTSSTRSFVGGSDTAPAAATLTGNAAGIDDAVVFELSGIDGSEVLSFGAGTSIEDIVAGINLVSDATGVSAAINGTDAGTIDFSSSAYGSDAFVDISIIDEGTGATNSGVFTTDLGEGERATGADIIASINGVSATGDGNNLSINTATLDLSATLTAGFTGTASFTITGGGAKFQLGPDVVSNQQARLGIGSVNTARLGGTDGKLFQLGSGGAFDLSTDATTAARVVEDAIDQVTSLRGRLGAFQRTSLETNRNALNDTLTNLTEAESSIRDADFAAETANLTRSQILVQSGTRVLAIANQNPQNVLALLG